MNLVEALLQRVQKDLEDAEDKKFTAWIERRERANAELARRHSQRPDQSLHEWADKHNGHMREIEVYEETVDDVVEVGHRCRQCGDKFVSGLRLHDDFN